MQKTRRLRLQSVILEELSTIVPREIKDPRIPMITFTSVEVTDDGSEATVYVSILGRNLDAPQTPEEAAAETPEQTEARERADDAEMKDCLAGLASASGYLRRHLATILNVRHVPKLHFREDRGIQNVSRVFHLLKQIEKEKS